jgi:hypothetical protein
MNRKFFGLAFVLLSLSLIPGAALADGDDDHPKQDRVKGTGQTGQIKIRVDAKGARKGASARGKVQFSDLSDPTSPVNLKGRVSCVDVAGSDAVVAGTVEEYGREVDLPPDFGGVFFLYISDTGRRGSGSDRWAAQLALGPGQTPPDTCTALPGSSPLDRGDFTVRDGAAAGGERDD